MKKIVSVILSAIIIIFPLLLASCGSISAEKELDNFSFSIRWGVYGQSSYDSRTGILIKTTDVIKHSPSDYKTNLKLSDEQKK